MAKTWYNGYSPDARTRKGRSKPRGMLWAGSCAMCGDPSCRVEPHSEDYAEPYRWQPPAVYALCQTCHRRQLHKRFSDPTGWFVFKAHVRRGGYASELATCAKELRRFRKLVERALPADLEVIRVRRFAGNEWWDKLSTDPLTLTAMSARPR